MKVFLAGATGVLGRPTVQALVNAGHQLRGTARGPEKAEMQVSQTSRKSLTRSAPPSVADCR